LLCGSRQDRGKRKISRGLLWIGLFDLRGESEKRVFEHIFTGCGETILAPLLFPMVGKTFSNVWKTPEF